MSNQKNLEILVCSWVAKKDSIKDLRNKKLAVDERLGDIKIPKSVNSIVELEQIKRTRQSILKDAEKILMPLAHLETEVMDIERSIAGYIPYDHVWVKVGKYAVAVLNPQNNPGDNYISIIEWSDNPPFIPNSDH